MVIQEGFEPPTHGLEGISSDLPMFLFIQKVGIFPLESVLFFTNLHEICTQIFVQR